MLRPLIAAVLALSFVATPFSMADGLRGVRLQRKVVRDILYKKGRRPTRPVLQQLLPDLQVLSVDMTKDHTQTYDYPKVHVVIRNVGHVPTLALLRRCQPPQQRRPPDAGPRTDGRHGAR